MRRGMLMTAAMWLAAGWLAVHCVERVSGQGAPPARPLAKLVEESFAFDADEPTVGHWHGNLHSEVGDVPVSLLVERVGEAYRVVATVAPGNRPHQVCEDVEVDGGMIRFRFPLDPIEAGYLEFAGEVRDDGQRLSGSVAWPGVMEVPGRFELGRMPRPLDLPEPLAFRGEIDLDEEDLFELTLVMAETPGGHWMAHLDIREQEVAGWMLDRVEWREGAFIFSMGGTSPATFELRMDEARTRLEGRYRQFELDLPMVLERVEAYALPMFGVEELVEIDEPAPRAIPATRPQTPVMPLPYTSFAFRAAHPAGHELAGTLTIPDGDGPFPVVVLLSAEGPRERDQVIYGHRMFLLLSDRLTRAGVAVYRYDDRGVGESTGAFGTASTADFATDALAVVAALTKRPELDTSRLIFIGHNEGAHVALLAAAELPETAGLALLGPSFMNGREAALLRTQLRLVENESDAASRQRVKVTQEALLEAIERGAEQDELLRAATEMVEAQLAATSTNPRSAPIEALARQMLHSMNSPWMRFYLAFDPAEVLAKVEVPVLLMAGGKDMETPPGENMPIAGAVLADHENATIRVYPELNHLFQPAETGYQREYSQIEVTFDETALADLVKWVRSIISQDGA